MHDEGTCHQSLYITALGFARYYPRAGADANMRYQGNSFCPEKLSAKPLHAQLLQVSDPSYETARSELGELRAQLKKAQAAAGRPAGQNGGMAKVGTCLSVKLVQHGLGETAPLRMNVYHARLQTRGPLA